MFYMTSLNRDFRHQYPNCGFLPNFTKHNFYRSILGIVYYNEDHTAKKSTFYEHPLYERRKYFDCKPDYKYHWKTPLHPNQRLPLYYKILHDTWFLVYQRIRFFVIFLVGNFPIGDPLRMVFSAVSHIDMIIWKTIK